MTPLEKGNLPRLEKHHYQGHAVVFWTNTLEERALGWLTIDFHSTFRELMLHAAVREELFCPAYCLMPDHLHLIWMGMRRESDQLIGIKFLRTHLEPALGGVRESQRQPHDHVLREKERMRNAFANICFYTLANPVRAELVKSERQWPYNGLLFHVTRCFIRSKLAVRASVHFNHLRSGYTDRKQLARQLHAEVLRMKHAVAI